MKKILVIIVEPISYRMTPKQIVDKLFEIAKQNEDWDAEIKFHDQNSYIRINDGESYIDLSEEICKKNMGWVWTFQKRPKWILQKILEDNLNL